MSSRRTFGVLAIVLVALAAAMRPAFAACTTLDATTVEYSYEDVQALFDSRCISCHSGGALASGSLDLQIGSYANLVNVTSAGYSPAIRVVPGNTGSSILFDKINCDTTGQMPADGTAPMAVADQKLIREWISGGCINIATNFNVTRSSSTPTAGSIVTITARIRDGSNNNIPRSGIVVTWSSTNGGSFASPTSTTNSSGIASVSFTTSTVAGTVHTVTATTTGMFNASSTSGNITTQVGAASKYLVSSSSSTPVAGSNVTITAQLADANNNAVSTSGLTVTWSKTGTGGSFSSGTSTTNASGIATVTFTTHTVAGTVHTVTGTTGGFTGTTSNITTQVGAASKYIVSSNSSTPIAGANVTITAQLADSNNNSVSTSGLTVTWSKTGTGGSFSSGTSNTNGSGIATVTFTTHTVSGTVHTVTATTGGITGTTANITTQVGPAAKYIVNTSSTGPVAGSNVTITAQLADANNNAVTTPVSTVTWSSSNGGSFSSSTSNTNGSGIATVTYTTNVTVGSGTVTGTDGSSRTGTSPTITTIAGAATKYLVTSSSNNPTTASSVTISAQLSDANNNAVNGLRTVNWSSTNGGSLGASSSATNASGLAQVSFTVSSTTGTVHTVTGNDGTFSGTTGNITTVTGSPTQYVVTASTSSPVAGSTITVSAQYADVGGNPVATAGRVVNWSFTGTGGSLSGSSSTTNASGIATINFTTSTVSGRVYTFTANDGTFSGTSGNVTTVPGPADHYAVTSSGSSPVAGSNVTIFAQLQDVNNNSISTPGRNVNWSSTNGGSFSASSTSTNGSGLAQVTFTTSTVSGTVHTVTGNDGSVSGTSGSITTVPGAPTHYLASVSNSSPMAGENVTITFQLADTNDNSVPTAGRVVTWSSTGGGSFATSTSTTNASGVATVTFTVNTVSNTAHTVSGTDGGGLTGTTATFTTVPNVATQYLVTTTSNSPIAGDTVTISAQLADVYNNSVSTSGLVVTWTDSSGTGGSFSTSTSTTGATGLATVVFTTSTVSAVTHTIRGTDTGSLTGATGTITTIPGPAAKYILGIDISNPIAGTDVVATAQLADVNNNSISESGHTVTWSKSGSGGAFASPTTSTDASGIATVTFTVSTTALTVHTITATDENTISGVTGSITTRSGPATHYTVQTGVTSVAAGNAITITAQLRDVNGNTVSAAGSIVTWSTSANGTFNSPTSTTGASGAATVQFTVDPLAGTSQTVTATDDSLLTGTSSAVLTKAGAATQYVVTSSDSNPVAGSAVTITAQLADAFGNAVATQNKTVSWTRVGAGGSFSAASSTTTSSGLATVAFTTSTISGIAYTVSGTDTGGLTGASSAVTTQVGAPTGYVVQVSDDNPVAGSTVTATAQLVDANGNAVPGAGNVITWSSDGGTFSAATSTTDAGGLATIQFTSSATTGSFTITATDGTLVSGESDTVTSIAGAATQYLITSSASTAALGVAVRITAQLADANGNAVASSGKVLTWSSQAGGVFSTATSTTKSNGSATVSFSSGTAGSYTVTGTDTGGLSGTSGVIAVGEVVPGAPLITSALTAAATAGTAFSYTITASGDNPITFAAAPLPAELALSGDTISGTPASAGTLTVTLTATNGLGSDSKTLVIQVSSQGGGGTAVITPDGEFVSTDSDGDKILDVFERLSGTDPNNAADSPKKSDALSVDGAKAKLNFAKPDSDSISFKLTFTLPGDFQMEGSTVSIAFGELLSSTLTLDAKGKSPKGIETIAIRRASSGSSFLILNYTAKKQELKDELGASGLIDDNLTGAVFKVPVAASLKTSAGTYVFDGSVNLKYKAVKGKGGSASRSAL